MKGTRNKSENQIEVCNCLLRRAFRQYRRQQQTSEVSGQKAVGLLALPQVWTLAFFVVDSEVVQKCG